MGLIKSFLGASAAACLAVQALAIELVMVEQAGCVYCASWDAEIAPAYPNSPEGRFAPLRRVGLRALPDDLTVARRVMFTPTFLIVENGQELGRLEGYPGEHFFWPVLDELLKKHAGYKGEQG